MKEASLRSLIFYISLLSSLNIVITLISHNKKNFYAEIPCLCN